MITETSQLAYKNDALPNLGNRQNEVLWAIRELGECTNTEISRELGKAINTITPHTNELVKLGKGR